jgi:hypothetical protein
MIFIRVTRVFVAIIKINESFYKLCVDEYAPISALALSPEASLLYYGMPFENRQPEPFVGKVQISCLLEKFYDRLYAHCVYIFKHMFSFFCF